MKQILFLSLLLSAWSCSQEYSLEVQEVVITTEVNKAAKTTKNSRVAPDTYSNVAFRSATHPY